MDIIWYCTSVILSKNEVFIKWIDAREIEGIGVGTDNIHKNAIMCHQYH